ncbi:uncharacterized protein LOC101689455 isoform X1 [Mustela putorius furo]|uniref:Uncharacterized protein LOC101689455 isoform X1 n=1 Tax=Mustela putorius furo TaxID=9669 RepID=A0A8U0RF44_MUSPF|nr:uncharacterized protein LOC101689455 isoform X1 [Mustela putorius furo]
MLSKRNHSDCRVRGCADHRNAETESNTRQPAREGPRSPEGRSGRKERVLGETGVFKPLSQPPLNCSALSPLPTGDPATATSVQESHGPPTPPLTRICGRICVALARPAALRYCAGRDFLRTTGNRKGLLSTGRREEAFPRSTRQGRVRPWRAVNELCRPHRSRVLMVWRGGATVPASGWRAAEWSRHRLPVAICHSKRGHLLSPHLGLGMSMRETAKGESKFIIQKPFYGLCMHGCLLSELRTV